MAEKPVDLERAKQLFHEALTKPAEDRSSFLVEACGDNSTLRIQVETLLRAHEEAGEFLSEPTATIGRLARDEALSEEVGATVGPYKLLQLIGEGGFGSVYMAEQKRPVKRRVALKIITLGRDPKLLIGRFAAARQALAMMDHPNIARVLEAGATDKGRPYFVMELVRGVPITEYCDTNNLSTKERLELFTPVCQAVQHAHQKGVIHRDIKPSNVLVTSHDGKPVPKVIDFGIAKATSRELTEKTVFTGFRQLIGTPEYMSPEQAEMSGLDIDTRADIYSLGVLLYELLTGTTPFDSQALRQAGYGEIQRIIREEEPPKPSTRLSTLGNALTEIARHRRAEPGVLSKLLRGDLDWIVMKALEKDRTRRYDTAAGLAADVQHHLSDEPVLASPPSAAYKLRKFIRRNRTAFTAATVVLAVLVLGIIGTTWGLRAASIAEQETVNQRAEAARARRMAHASRRERIAALLESDWERGDPQINALYEDFFSRLKGGQTDEQERSLFLSNALIWEVQTRRMCGLDYPLHVARWLRSRVNLTGNGILLEGTTKYLLNDRQVQEQNWDFRAWQGSNEELVLSLTDLAAEIPDLQVPSQIELTTATEVSFVWDQAAEADIPAAGREAKVIYREQRATAQTILVLPSLPEGYPVAITAPDVVPEMEGALRIGGLLVRPQGLSVLYATNAGRIHLAGRLEIVDPAEENVEITSRLVLEPGITTKAGFQDDWTAKLWPRVASGEVTQLRYRLTPDRGAALSVAALETYCGLPVEATAPVVAVEGENDWPEEIIAAFRERMRGD